MMTLSEKLSLAIITLRKQRGMTQINVADAAGLSRATYNRFESQAHNVGIETMEAIASVFEMSIVEILVLLEGMPCPTCGKPLADETGPAPDTAPPARSVPPIIWPSTQGGMVGQLLRRVAANGKTDITGREMFDLRGEMNMTQDMWAEAMGVSQRTVCRWEKCGDKQIQLRTGARVRLGRVLRANAV